MSSTFHYTMIVVMGFVAFGPTAIFLYNWMMLRKQANLLRMEVKSLEETLRKDEERRGEENPLPIGVGDLVEVTIDGWLMKGHIMSVVFPMDPDEFGFLFQPLHDKYDIVLSYDEKVKVLNPNDKIPSKEETQANG